MRDVILSSSVLIIAILAIRTLAKGKISARLQYALWLLVAVRLIVPGTIGSSPISVQRLIQFSAGDAGEADTGDVSAADAESQTIGSIVSDMDFGISAYLGGNAGTYTDISTGMDANGNIHGNTDIADAGISGGIADGADVFGSAADDMNGDSRDDQAVNASANTGTNLLLALPWRNVIYGIWIIGIVITSGYVLMYQIRFAKYLKARRRPLHGKHGQYHGLKVYTVEGLPSPCLCGKRIYLDGKMVGDDRKLNHVLAHEYCHYRQLDMLWAYVRCILVSVYWFHPLVWAAAYASKQDSEFACDEAAIRLLGEAQRYEYGRTLLGLVSLKTSKMQDIGAALTMGSSEKGMRERIGRIAKRQKPLVIAGSLVLVLAALSAVVTFTGTRQKTGLMMLDADTGTTLVEADITDKLSDSEALEEEKNRILQEVIQRQAEAAKLRKAEEAKEVEQREEELRKKAEELAAQEAQAMQESASVIALLDPYDEMLLPVKGEGREGEIRNLPRAIIRKPSELWEEYLSQGEDAIIEGLYLLASWNGREGQSMPQWVSDTVEDIISVYGLYTKEYGLRGVKIVVGEGEDKDVNNFDIPWSFLGASRVHVFETYPGDETSDGLPRTFAFKQLIPGSESSYMNYGAEPHELYLCDRYDTGHIEISKVSEGEFALQIQNRISCRMNHEEQKIYVYDNGTPVGEIDASEFSETDLGLVKAVVNTDYIDFVLGSNTGNIWINVPVALQTESESKERQTWFPLYSFIDFPIDCGYFGPDREFTLGKAALDTAHVAGIRYVEQQNGDF